jgi:hypothetical protein
MNRPTRRLLGIIAAVLAVLSLGYGLEPTHAAAVMDQLLQKQAAFPQSVPVQVIVRVAPGWALCDVDLDIRAVGGTVTGVHPQISALDARISSRRLSELARKPSVASISSDGRVKAHASNTNPWTLQLPNTET